MDDKILLTNDILERYRISRSTLYFWSTPNRMPSTFICPFPKPTVQGNPKRWRESEIIKWEDAVHRPTDGIQ
jgi:predicted DNA-binding transcriptional regulator AlpA